MAEGLDTSGDELNIHLPLHIGASLGKTQSHPPSEIRILLIYHDKKTCESLASLLRITGYDVVNVLNGSEAKVISKFWDFDILIVDEDLSDADGLSISGDIKKLHPSVGAILLSEFTRSTDTKELKAIDADVLVTKPVDPDELITIVEKLARNKRLESDIHNIEMRYYEILDLISEGVFFIDLNGNFLEINRSGSKILGYDEPSKAISGSGVKEHFTVNDDFQVLQLKAFNEGGVEYDPLCFRRLDGSFGWLEITLKPRINLDGEPRIGWCFL